MKLQKIILNTFATSYPKNMHLSHAETFYAKEAIQNINQNRKIPTFDPKTLVFGSQPSEHMVIIQSEQSKWRKPVIKPFQNVLLNPFNSTLHYGVQCYEGLKAYKNQKGQIRLFRAECNMKRFKSSSIRASLPDFDGTQLLKILKQYVIIQESYIPPIKGHSLYLRPFHISLQDSLGVKAPSKSAIIIVSSPVGPYYPTGFNPISLYCDTYHIRSAPGGTGGFKLGGQNYGPTILVSSQAAKKGHQQVLWLYNKKVCQVGSSNIFFVLTDKKTGKKTVITPELQDLVLPGITRDSIIELLKSKGVQVQERIIMIDELTQRLQSGEVTQCFGAGTAVIVSPVKNIEYNGKNYPLKINPQYKSGELTYEIFNNILDIQEGRKQDPFDWISIIKK